METYYARSENSSGEKETIQHHLARTGELCRAFLAPIGYGGWGEQMGRLHDLGKWSEDFQKVLAGELTHVNHALPGAVVVQNCQAMSAAIASHHGALQSFGVYEDTLKRVKRGEGPRLDGQNNTVPIFGREEYAAAISRWKQAFALEKLEQSPRFQGEEDPTLSKMLFQRFLYSALIDADWSSSAEHFEADYLSKNTGAPLDAEKALARLLELRREKQRASRASGRLNALRDELFDSCMAAGKEPPGLFTLTAPTGLGKTISLMAFALQHCITHGKRKVILALPYLSILEQNCGEYRRVIPELLEIHSNAPWTRETAALMERQAAGCIVTTNVGLLEPLFSAEAGRCRHLHQLANSVIVLDEAQTLPKTLLDATLRTVKELCQRYGCTVVFSTATQPSFQFREGLSWQPREIVSQPQVLFNAVRRAKWQWRTQTQIPLSEIAEEMGSLSQCCVILNLKKHVQRMMEELAGQSDVFCLTTDLCMAHRERVLDEIRRRLSEGLPCRLVATQCVEAGVDLDFPVVYRALAPLDSLIQAAGRCNRNGDGCDGSFIVFVPEEQGRSYPTPDYEAAADCVRTLLARHEIDSSNLQHIAEYYELLYANSDADNYKLREAISNEDYPEVQRNYRLISKETVQVIVPYENEMELFREICREVDQGGLSRDILRKAKSITVSTYHRDEARRLCEQLCFNAPGGVRVATDFFLLHDGRYYDKRAGLNFNLPFDGIF